jgi:hypothetical protein
MSNTNQQRSWAMSRSIRIIFALAAVIALAAVSSASASAALQHFYIEGVKIPVGEEKTVTGTSIAPGFSLKTTLGGVTIHINCTNQTSTTDIRNPVGGGAGEVLPGGTITFTGCTVEPAAQNCKAHSPGQPVETIKVENVKGKATEQPAGTPGVLFEPGAGTVFVNIVLEGCKTTGMNGTKEVKGTDFGIADNPNGELHFTEESSNLTFGPSPAFLTGVSAIRKGTEKVEVKP